MDSQIKTYALRNKYTVVGKDIIHRWETRMVENGWVNLGRRGGEEYLKKYGKSIGEEKCKSLAVYATTQCRQEIADVFWEKAYSLSNQKTADENTHVKREKFDGLVAGQFMQAVPSTIVRMNIEDYINSPDYWGHIHNGKNLVFFCDKDKVVIQDVYGNMAFADKFESDIFELKTHMMNLAIHNGEYILEGEWNEEEKILSVYWIIQSATIRMSTPPLDALVSSMCLNEYVSKYTSYLFDKSDQINILFKTFKTEKEKKMMINIQKQNGGEVVFFRHTQPYRLLQQQGYVKFW